MVGQSRYSHQRRIYRPARNKDFGDRTGPRHVRSGYYGTNSYGDILQPQSYRPQNAQLGLDNYNQQDLALFVSKPQSQYALEPQNGLDYGKFEAQSQPKPAFQNIFVVRPQISSVPQNAGILPIEPPKFSAHNFYQPQNNDVSPNAHPTPLNLYVGFDNLKDTSLGLPVAENIGQVDAGNQQMVSGASANNHALPINNNNQNVAIAQIPNKPQTDAASVSKFKLFISNMICVKI